MTRIKICGITNSEDAWAAVSYGADALGFICVPSSPRDVSRNSAIPELLRDLPPYINRVAVRHEKGIYDDRLEKRFDAVQFYANTLGTRFPVGRKMIQAFRIRDKNSLTEIFEHDPDTDAILLDTYHQDKLGGSGETFNWELAVEAKRLTTRPLILAGGLTPDNVQDALEAVRPYAVDVSSGVEHSPGVKDHTKVRAFIRAVRAWDLRQE